MAQVIKITHDVDPGDVYVSLECSESGKKFRVSLDGGETNVTCRCAHEQWEIEAEPLRGFLKLSVTNINKWGKRTEVEQFGVTIDES